MPCRMNPFGLFICVRTSPMTPYWIDDADKRPDRFGPDMKAVSTRQVHTRSTAMRLDGSAGNAGRIGRGEAAYSATLKGCS